MSDTQLEAELNSMKVTLRTIAGIAELGEAGALEQIAALAKIASDTATIRRS